MNMLNRFIKLDTLISYVVAIYFSIKVALTMDFYTYFYGIKLNIIVIILSSLSNALFMPTVKEIIKQYDD